MSRGSRQNPTTEKKIDYFMKKTIKDVGALIGELEFFKQLVVDMYDHSKAREEKLKGCKHEN